MPLPFDWKFRRSLKYGDQGVTRTIPPSETIRRIAPLMPVIGVTRIADVTGLDRVGIPNFVSVRPRDRHGITYYNGKGRTRIGAKAGAMMEALERYSGERCDLEVFYGTRNEMRRRGRALDPAGIIVPWFEEYRSSTRLEWVEGFDLIAREPTYVPLNSVVQPYEAAKGRRLYYSSTNGLASGNTMEEAVCHALCEVIERDAAAISGVALELKPAVSRILSGIGMAQPLDRSIDGRFSLIDLKSLPAFARRLVRKFEAARLKVFLRNLTCTAGIPTFECTIVETQLDGRHLAHGGSGTHPDARVAVSRALTEAAQSRVGCIQGGREDLPNIVRERVEFDPDDVFGVGPVAPFSAVTSFEHGRIDHDIEFLLRRLQREGLEQVVAVDLTRPELGVPVVKIIIPNAETWTVFHLHAERSKFGPRVRQLMNGASSCHAARRIA